MAVRVALLGCGVVGSEVARLIIGQAEDLRARVGRPLELVGIAVRDGRIRDGQRVMLLGVGGGFTWGSVLVRW